VVLTPPSLKEITEILSRAFGVRKEGGAIKKGGATKITPSESPSDEPDSSIDKSANFLDTSDIRQQSKQARDSKKG
jgi:hypothetical protein